LSGYLAVPAAIDFLEGVGLEYFRHYGHTLAKYGADLVDEVTGISPPTDRDQGHGTMSLAELPMGETHELRAALWDRHRIEIPVLHIAGRRFLRISAHLYNTREDMHRLAEGIADAMRG
jgi:isopenicillin-N epimerase